MNKQIPFKDRMLSCKHQISEQTVQWEDNIPQPTGVCHIFSCRKIWVLNITRFIQLIAYTLLAVPQT